MTLSITDDHQYCSRNDNSDTSFSLSLPACGKLNLGAELKKGGINSTVCGSISSTSVWIYLYLFGLGVSIILLRCAVQLKTRFMGSGFCLARSPCSRLVFLDVI